MTERHDVPRVSTNIPTSPRIIVAENDPVFRKLIASHLRRDGFRVDEVADGASLLRHVTEGRTGFNKDRLDLVIATTCLPGLGCVGMLLGIEAKLQELPLVFIKRTGESRPQILTHLPEGRAVHCQPFELSRMRRLVRCLISTEGEPVSCRIAV